MLFSVGSGYLLISGSQSADTGRYSCIAENEAGINTAKANVVVSGKIREAAAIICVAGIVSGACKKSYDSHPLGHKKVCWF